MAPKEDVTQNHNNNAAKQKAKEEKENDKLIKKQKRKDRDEILESLREIDYQDIKCGIWPFTPKWMQVFARREVYLIVYCCIGLVLGTFFTYSVSILSTIEKRFKLTSKQTGITLIGNDVSQVLLATVLNYFGNYGNRPKWIGAGVLCASFACFLGAIPNMMFGPGQDAIDVALALSPHLTNGVNSSGASTSLVPTNKNDLCHSPYLEDCSKYEGAYISPVVIIFFAQFFVGLAVSVYYSLGLVYLDDNVDREDTPLYYALSLIIRVLGPVMGFFLGSRCLALYIDPQYQPNLSLRDPRWMGAWWLGYLTLSGSLLLCGIIVLLFPRMLPITLCKQMQKAKKKEEEAGAFPGKEMVPISSNLSLYLQLATKSNQSEKPSLAKLPEALKRLFTNKVWVGYSLNTVITIIGLTGYWVYHPKYLEYQFRKSASAATFYTGLASFVASVVGLAVSGIVMRIFRPGPRFIAGYSIFLTIFSSFAMVALMFVRCSQLEVVGPHYTGDSELEQCGLECGCTDRYSPVCSEDGLTTFHSACYAGCTAVNSSVAPVVYYHCRCVRPSLTDISGVTNNGDNKTLYSVDDSQYSGGKTIQGYCPEDCNGFFYYIIITIITKAFDSTGRIGGTLIYMRSVREDDKGLALGMLTVLLSLFAFIPVPIIMGAIVDSACIIWDYTCGVSGNCWLYDSDRFRYIIHGIPAALLMLSVVGDIMVFVNSRGLVLYHEEEDEAHVNELKEIRPNHE